MKKLKELSYEELTNVIKNNYKIQEIASDYLLENAYFWIKEYMHDFPGSYEVNSVYKSTCKFDVDKFPLWYEHAQKEFCFLYNDYYIEHCEKLCKIAEKYVDVIYGCGYGEKNDNRIIEYTEKIIPIVEDGIMARLDSEIDLCYELEEIVSCIKDTDYLFDDYFYDSEKNKILKHIPEHYEEIA